MISPEIGSQLLHMVADGGGGSRKFDESKVKRDKGGKFSTIESRMLEDEAIAKLQEQIMNSPEWGKAMNEAAAAVGSIDTPDFDAKFAEALLPHINEQAKTMSEASNGSYVQFKLDGSGETKPYVVKKGAAQHSGLKGWGAGLSHSELTSFVEAQPGDGVWYGVLGMKWGRRRTDAQIAKDTIKRAAAGEEITATQKAKAAIKGGDETPAARYARLEVAAKSGGARNMSEEDLKFFNSRTEALSKINKLNQSNPSWLQTTSKKVLQQAAQTAMQDVANGVTKKFITAPILENLASAAADKKK